jgi:hypothetical protein
MPRPVTEQYAELMHYTTAAGISGIVSSGCLWATHAAFLNDSEEMRHFFDARLLDIAFAEVHEYAEELAQSAEIAKKMEEEGGIEQVARAEAKALAAKLRSVTLDFNHPYIFSMSAAHDPLVSRSGLLSQWRGYGTDGGYALVFDTGGVEQLLRLEGTTFHYQHAQWGDVHYYGINPSSQPSTEDVAGSEAVLRAGIAKLIRGGTTEDTDGFYQAISSLSCLYKHWGFWEEHEVRVVAIPVDAEVGRLAAAEGEIRREKEVKSFVRAGIPVPYLELFKPLDSAAPTRLPIKRVIVGPHPQKTVRMQGIKSLLAANGYDVEVVSSEIPYIGR